MRVAGQSYTTPTWRTQPRHLTNPKKLGIWRANTRRQWSWSHFYLELEKIRLDSSLLRRRHSPPPSPGNAMVGFVSRKVLKLREVDLASYDLPPFNTLRGGEKWGERKQYLRLSLTILTTIDTCVDERWGQDSILRLTRTHRKLLLSFSHWTPQQPAFLFITDGKLLRMSLSTFFASTGVFASADEVI